ncbi:MAG: septum formation initiator family protein [Alphaproteobacteria bacterium]|nr:septum formation initiator family protein [Alphaproteobacteria bacterium]MBF0129887.1 septum formation initiator family protein [Alphaproteobacteria bacterium]
MLTLREIRRRARYILGPLLGVGAVVYFSYHAVQGDRGLLAWWEVRHEIQQASRQLALVEAERDAWEKRVALLRPDSLDPDILEEGARVILNMGRPDEVVILSPER